MRTEPLGPWLVVMAAAWLVTGCATRAPLRGTGGVEPAAHSFHATGLPRDSGEVLRGASSAESSSEAGGGERLRRRRAVRMPTGTAVDVGTLGVLAAEAGPLEVDAFERLLVSAGLDPTEELPPRVNPLTSEEAARVLVLLLKKPVTLGHFPPRMAVGYLLREVLEGGEVSREELLRRVERFASVAVLRPDGYLAWVRTGRTQQKVAPVQWKDEAFRAGPFELGRFYSGRGGVFRLLDDELREADGRALSDVHDDADFVSRTLDGAEEAFVELALAVGHFFSMSPADNLATLQHLPAGLASLLASSPEYLERFRYMTRGEQVQVISKLVTSLIATWGTATSTARTLRGALASAEATVPVLSLSAEGVLVMERVSVPVGRVAAVLSGGPGAAVILQRTAAASKDSGPSGGPGQWGPAQESMSGRARRYQEQITGHSADEAYWVGGVGRNSGGVKFDGFEDGVLLEAKGPGYANKFLDNLDPKIWFKGSGARNLIEQAQRQLRAARGTGASIRWHIAEEKTADAIRKLLNAEGITEIEILFTSPLP